jgi:hypothetical protein
LFNHEYLMGRTVAAFAVAGAVVIGSFGLSAAADASPRHEVVKEFALPATMNPNYWVPEMGVL